MFCLFRLPMVKGCAAVGLIGRSAQRMKLRPLHTLISARIAAASRQRSHNAPGSRVLEAAWPVEIDYY